MAMSVLVPDSYCRTASAIRPTPSSAATSARTRACAASRSASGLLQLARHIEALHADLHGDVPARRPV